MRGEGRAAAVVPRRRARGASENVVAAARRESKAASKAVCRLHRRFKFVGDTHPGVDMFIFSRSVTDKKPTAGYSACAGAALKLRSF